MQISKEGANSHIEQVLKYKKELLDAQPAISPNALDYFAGKIISFVFKKEDVIALFHSDEVNSLRIYYGANPDTGRPSLVLIPGKYVEPQISSILLNATYAGHQFPKVKGVGDTVAPFDVEHDTGPVE